MNKLARFVAPVILIQVVSATLSFIGSLYLVLEFNLSYLGEISFGMAVFLVSYAVSSLGGTELTQKHYAETKLQEISLNLVIYQVISSLIVLLFLFVMFDLKIIQLFFVFIYIHSMIFIENISRFYFQDDKSFHGQLIISIPIVILWLLLISSIYLNINIDIYMYLMLSALLGLCFLIILSKESIFKINFVNINLFKGPWYSIYSSRLNVVILDWLPVFIFNSIGHLQLSGLYAMISKIYMPIVIITNGLVSYFLKNILGGSMNLQQISAKVLGYGVVILVFSCILYVAYSINLFGLRESSFVVNVSIGTFLAIILYRASYLVYLFTSQIFINVFISLSHKLMFILLVITPLLTYYLFYFTFHASGVDISLFLFIVPFVFLLINIFSFYFCK